MNQTTIANPNPLAVVLLPAIAKEPVLTFPIGTPEPEVIRKLTEATKLIRE